MSTAIAPEPVGNEVSHLPVPPHDLLGYVSRKASADDGQLQHLLYRTDSCSDEEEEETGLLPPIPPKPDKPTPLLTAGYDRDTDHFTEDLLPNMDWDHDPDRTLKEGIRARRQRQEQEQGIKMQIRMGKLKGHMDSISPTNAMLSEIEANGRGALVGSLLDPLADAPQQPSKLAVSPTPPPRRPKAKSTSPRRHYDLDPRFPDDSTYIGYSSEMPRYSSVGPSKRGLHGSDTSRPEFSRMRPTKEGVSELSVRLHDYMNQLAHKSMQLAQFRRAYNPMLVSYPQQDGGQGFKYQAASNLQIKRKLQRELMLQHATKSDGGVSKVASAEKVPMSRQQYRKRSTLDAIDRLKRTEAIAESTTIAKCPSLLVDQRGPIEHVEPGVLVGSMGIRRRRNTAETKALLAGSSGWPEDNPTAEHVPKGPLILPEHSVRGDTSHRSLSPGPGSYSMQEQTKHTPGPSLKAWSHPVPPPPDPRYWLPMDPVKPVTFPRTSRFPTLQLPMEPTQSFALDSTKVPKAGRHHPVYAGRDPYSLLVDRIMPDRPEQRDFSTVNLAVSPRGVLEEKQAERRQLEGERALRAKSTALLLEEERDTRLRLRIATQEEKNVRRPQVKSIEFKWLKLMKEAAASAWIIRTIRANRVSDAANRRRLQAAIVLQRVFKKLSRRRLQRKEGQAANIIVALVRGWLVRKRLLDRHRAADLLRTFFHQATAARLTKKVGMHHKGDVTIVKLMRHYVKQVRTIQRAYRKHAFRRTFQCEIISLQWEREIKFQKREMVRPVPFVNVIPPKRHQSPERGFNRTGLSLPSTPDPSVKRSKGGPAVAVVHTPDVPLKATPKLKLPAGSVKEESTSSSAMQPPTLETPERQMPPPPRIATLDLDAYKLKRFTGNDKATIILNATILKKQRWIRNLAEWEHNMEQYIVEHTQGTKAAKRWMTDEGNEGATSNYFEEQREHYRTVFLLNHKRPFNATLLTQRQLVTLIKDCVPPSSVFHYPSRSPVAPADMNKSRPGPSNDGLAVQEESHSKKSGSPSQAGASALVGTPLQATPPRSPKPSEQGTSP